MRTKEHILEHLKGTDFREIDLYILTTLLDIRDLLTPKVPYSGIRYKSQEEFDDEERLKGKVEELN